MSRESAPGEMPEDEMIPLPHLSARARRCLATFSLVAAIAAVLKSSLRYADKAISSLTSSSQTQTAAIGVRALVLLALVTFSSILLALVSWKRWITYRRSPRVLWGIAEGVAILFGLVVLAAWIPYLMIQPAAPSEDTPIIVIAESGAPSGLTNYLRHPSGLLASSERAYGPTPLEVWVMFCAPFLVGLVSTKRLERARYGFASAILTILLSSIVYTELTYAAFPPPSPSQIDSAPAYRVEVVRTDPFGRYPSGWVSAMMLVSLLIGLTVGYGLRMLVRGHPPLPTTRQLSLMVAGTGLLLSAFWLASIPWGGLEEIPPYVVVGSNASSRVLGSWVEPSDLKIGQNLTIYFRLKPIAAEFQLEWNYVSRLSGARGGGAYWAEIDSELVNHTVETSEWISKEVPPDEFVPMFLSYIALENLGPRRRLMRLWRMAVPNESRDARDLIEPCLYGSRLAFEVDPSFEPDRVLLLYFINSGGSGVRGLKKVGVKEGVYRVSSVRMLPRSMRSPEELGVWDPENKYLECEYSKDHAVFFAVAFKGKTVAVSNVYVS